MNKLIVIGWLGVKVCYLNISKEEAIKRFQEKEANYSVEELEKWGLITEFEFNDEFDAYDAWVPERFANKT